MHQAYTLRVGKVYPRWALTFALDRLGRLGSLLFAAYVVIVYGGPALAVLLGIVLRAISMRLHAARLERLATNPR